MVCPCTLYSACVVCPGTGELVGQHPPPISMAGSENGDCQPENKHEQGWSGGRKFAEDQLNKQNRGHGKGTEEVAHHTSSMAGV